MKCRETSMKFILQLCLIFSVATFCEAVSAEDLGLSSAGELAKSYRLLYFSDWRDGISSDMERQSARNEDIVIDRLQGSEFNDQPHVKVEKYEDVSRVANGKPRGEVVLPPEVRFQLGGDYLIRWFTYIPADYWFYSSEITTQIHQGPGSASPPIMLALTQRGYVFRQQGQEQGSLLEQDVCRASADRVKWVQWTLHYRPDGSGKTSITQLWKDCGLVFNTIGQVNAYHEDNSAYFKLGIYIPGGWKQPELGPIEVFNGPV